MLNELKMRLMYLREGLKTRNKGKLKQCISGSPLERLANDILAPFAITASENISCGIHGLLFEMARSGTNSKSETSTVANSLLENIARHGIAQEVHTSLCRGH